MSTSDFTPTTELLTGSPKNMATYFIMVEFQEFSRNIRVKSPNIDIDAMTADLLSYCPDTKKRDELLDRYVKRKDDPKIDKSQITAAILTKGDMWAYICEVLEFTEKSAGAF
jgi:hypothetical protein